MCQDMADMSDRQGEIETKPNDLQGMIDDVGIAEESFTAQLEVIEPQIADLRERVKRFNKMIFSLEDKRDIEKRNLTWKQEDLYHALYEEGADTSGLDPLLVHGLNIHYGKVGKAREWIRCVEDTRERLDVANTAFLVIERNGDRKLPASLMLARTNGQPTSLEFAGRHGADLIINTAAEATITDSRSEGNFKYKRQVKDGSVNLASEKLIDLRKAHIFIAEEEIVAKIDQLMNSWGIFGHEEVVNDVMFFLWKAAADIGNPELIPERLKEFIPKWKASYLAEVTGTMATRLSGVSVDKLVLPASYLRNLAESFSFSEDDVDKLIYRATAQARHRGGDTVNEEELEALPYTLGTELGIKAEPIVVSA